MDRPPYLARNLTVRRLRSFLGSCGCGLALGVATISASAQNWPTRPLRVVVPFTAGSATDVTARMVVERLSAQLGYNFVVENRPGAGGTIGVGVVAKAEPDGYTILCTHRPLP